MIVPKEEINMKSIQQENIALLKTIFKTSPKNFNENLNSPKSTQQISNVNRQFNFQYDQSENNNQNNNELHEGVSQNVQSGNSYLNNKNTRNSKTTNSNTNTMPPSGSNSTNLINNNLAKIKNSNKSNSDVTEIGEKRKLIILIPDNFKSSIEIRKVSSSSSFSTMSNLVEKIDVLKFNYNDWVDKPEITINAAPSLSAEASSSYTVQQSLNNIGPVERRKKNKKNRNVPYNVHRQDQQNISHINKHETEPGTFRPQHQVTVNAKLNDAAVPNVTITYAVENCEQVLSSSGPIRNRRRNRNKQSVCPYQININSNPVIHTAIYNNIPNHVDTPRAHDTFKYNVKPRLCWNCKSDTHIFRNCPSRVSRSVN